MTKVATSDKDWNAWATLANHVSEAVLEGLRDLGPMCRPMLSERSQIAQILWDMGYRPTPEQIAAEQQRQQERSPFGRTS